MIYHPELNDEGNKVRLHNPSIATTIETWAAPTSAATVTPNGDLPRELNGIAFDEWIDHPRNNVEWECLAAKSAVDEPPFLPPKNKKSAAGVVIEESDGRIWLVAPSNAYGGYTATFPKGTVEYGTSMLATALKEAFEKTGLKVELTGFFADRDRSTSHTRYYFARRVDGNPANMGWESQAVLLVPPFMLSSFLTNEKDRTLLEELPRLERQPTRADLLKSYTLTSGCRIVFTVNSFRTKYGKWPKKVLMDSGMAKALPEHVLTPLGWAMLATKLELVVTDNGTVIAEGEDGTSFNYDDCDYSLPADGIRADEWIWGIRLAD